MSYEEQRMAELAYAEEYRRRIRSNRGENNAPSADVTAESDSCQAERVQREADEAVEREREAARERRRQTMDLFARASQAYAAPKMPDSEQTDGTEKAAAEDLTEGEATSWEPIARREEEPSTARGGAAHDKDGGKIYVDGGVRVHRLFVDGTTLDNIGVDISGGPFAEGGYTAPVGSAYIPAEPTHTPVGNVKHGGFDEFFSAYDSDPSDGNASEQNYSAVPDSTAAADDLDDDIYDFEPITRSTDNRGADNRGSVKSDDVFYSPIADFEPGEDASFAFIPGAGAEFEPEYGTAEQSVARSTGGESVYADEDYRRFLEREKQRNNGFGAESAGSYAEPIADDYEELDGVYTAGGASSRRREREMPEDYRYHDTAERYRPEQYSDSHSGAQYGYNADTAVEAEDYSVPMGTPLADEGRDMMSFIEYYRDQDRTAGGPSHREYRTTENVDSLPDEHMLDDISTTAQDSEYDALEDKDNEEMLDGAAMRRQMEKEMDELLRRDRRERRERSRTAAPAAGGVPDSRSGEVAPYNRSALNKKKNTESDADVSMIKARITSQISALESELDKEALSFSARTGREKRLINKKKRELKRLRSLLARALKYEKQDNERYYSLVIADIPRMKLPRSANMPAFVDARERLVHLLAKRDELNRRLTELYSYIAGGTGSARDKAKHDAMHREYKKQAKFVGKLRRSGVDYEIRKLMSEVVDEQVSLRGVIAECEYSLRREKPKGASKRQLTSRLKDAVRKYARNEKQLLHISRTALLKAKDRTSRKRAATWAWISLGLLVAAALVVWWQWDNIIALASAYFPALGALVPQ